MSQRLVDIYSTKTRTCNALGMYFSFFRHFPSSIGIVKLLTTHLQPLRFERVKKKIE